MSAEHDRQFFDTFMIVLGALVAFTFIVYFLANAIGNRTQGRYIEENPLKASLVSERIAPIGQVAVEGQPEPVAARSASTPPAAVPVAVASPAAAPEPEVAMPAVTEVATSAQIDGKAIYQSGCLACHMTGVAGAPKFGDAQAWAPRIAKGIDTLYANSINGFQGEAGVMPPKGGRMDLGDAEIKAAVDYMVEQSQ